MARRPKNRIVTARYFNWILYKHPNGTYWVDGRGNNAAFVSRSLRPLGRLSLGTDQLALATGQIHVLDTAQAVQRGLALHSAMTAASGNGLSIAAGRAHYLSQRNFPQYKASTSSLLKRFQILPPKSPGALPDEKSA